MAVEKNLYIKTVKRLHQETLLKRTKFLRQIDFIVNWGSKDVADLNSLLKTLDCSRSNFRVAQEGKPVNNVYIVKSGEFKVTKTGLQNVFMNPKSGMIQLNLPNSLKIKSSELHPITK